MRTYMPHIEWAETCFTRTGDVKIPKGYQRILQRIETLHLHVSGSRAAGADREWADAMVGVADVAVQWLEVSPQKDAMEPAWELLNQCAAIFNHVVCGAADHRKQAMLLKRWHTCRAVFVSYLVAQHVRDSAVVFVLRKFTHLREGGLPRELLETPTRFAMLCHTVIALGKLFDARAVYDGRSREHRAAMRACGVLRQIVADERNPAAHLAYFADVYECFHEAPHRSCTTRARRAALRSLAEAAGVPVPPSGARARSAHKSSRRVCA